MDRLGAHELEAMECLLTSIEQTPVHIEQLPEEEMLEISSPDCGKVKINCAMNSVSATIRQIFGYINKHGTIFEGAY